MGVLEIFASIVLIVVVIKIVVILISPRSWLNFTRKIWKFPVLTMGISLILAGIVFYYIIQELSITQVFAVMLLVVFLSAITMAVYVNEFLALAQKLLKEKHFLKRAWLSILIWIALSIWAAKELFF